MLFVQRMRYPFCYVNCACELFTLSRIASLEQMQTYSIIQGDASMREDFFIPTPVNGFNFQYSAIFCASRSP